MWHLGTWFSGGLVSAGGMVGLDDPRGLYNPNDSMTLYHHLCYAVAPTGCSSAQIREMISPPLLIRPDFWGASVVRVCSDCMAESWGLKFKWWCHFSVGFTWPVVLPWVSHPSGQRKAGSSRGWFIWLSCQISLHAQVVQLWDNWPVLCQTAESGAEKEDLKSLDT